MREKAIKFFELTNTADFPRPIKPNAPERMKQIHQLMSDSFRELKIGLIEKHYTDDQLDALINLYESDLGTSILDSQVSLENEIREKWPEVMAQNFPESNGNLDVLIKWKKPESDDT